jgi:DeoR/GlpR family transcriptional regulator of sugar metabolism
MEYKESSATLKRAMLSSSRKRVLLIDHTKLDMVQMFSAVRLDEVNIVITDKYPGAEYDSFCKENDVELIVTE